MSKPGWYQDHSSQVPEWRYWDGNQWTDQTAPIYAPVRDVPQQTNMGSTPATSQEDPFVAENQPSRLFSRRIAAYIIDYLLVYVFAVPVWFVISWIWNQPDAAQTNAEQLTALTNSIVLMCLTSAVGYFLLELIFIRRDSATPGMRLLSLRIEPRESWSLGLVALYRALFFAVLAALPVPGLVGLSLSSTSAKDLLTVWALAILFAVGPASLISTVFYIGCCAVLWSPTRQAWHDRLTQVQIRAHLDLTGQLVKPDSKTTKTILYFAVLGVIAVFAMNFALNGYTSIVEKLLVEAFPGQY